MDTELGRLVTYHWELPTIKSHDTESCGVPRSRGKLKQLHLHNPCAYGHQNWQGGDFHEDLGPIKSNDP